MADLNTTLGTLPSGNVARLSDDDLTRYLRDKYNTDGEANRRKASKLRLDFYRDNASSYFEADLRKLFKNNRVLNWRKELLPFALYQNFTRRVVVETSTVYSKPTRRTIDGKKANKGYQTFQRR